MKEENRKVEVEGANDDGRWTKGKVVLFEQKFAIKCNTKPQRQIAI